MATAKQLTAEYIEFIGTKVIDKFGGSYQNYNTLGKTWRQKLEYSPKIEEFLIAETKVFLRMQEFRLQTNFNLLYVLCNGIGDYLSKYLVKKSANLTRNAITENIVNEIFLSSERFITKFQTTYKKPIDMTNAHYVASNPGIIAMYNSVLKKRQY